MGTLLLEMLGRNKSALRQFFAEQRIDGAVAPPRLAAGPRRQRRYPREISRVA